MRPSSAREANCSEKFKGEAIEPIVVSELEKRVALGSARVIDHDVDAAKLARGEIRKPGGAFREAQIERHRSGSAAVAFNLANSGVEGAGGASAQDGLRALFRQTRGDGASYASAGPGDDGYFAGEAGHYCCAP